MLISEDFCSLARRTNSEPSDTDPVRSEGRPEGLVSVGESSSLMGIKSNAEDIHALRKGRV